MTICSIPHRFANGRIDWFFNASADRTDVAMTREWQWQLNRMQWWPQLGSAWLATGDERYARAFAEQSAVVGAAVSQAG